MNSTQSVSPETVRVFILYWSNLKAFLGGDDILVGFSNDGLRHYVRLEEVVLPVNKENPEGVLSDALDLAKPREGEVVLNTVFA
jgi:hypothetical protein